MILMLLGHNRAWYASKEQRTRTENGLISMKVNLRDFNYKCQICTKVCISKDDFLRNVQAKHKDKETDLPYSRRGAATSQQSKLKNCNNRTVGYVCEKCRKTGQRRMLHSRCHTTIPQLLKDVILDYKFFLLILNSFPSDT